MVKQTGYSLSLYGESINISRRVPMSHPDPYLFCVNPKQQMEI